MKENPFEKYYLYVTENGKIIDVNPKSLELSHESFDLFRELYNQTYGSIDVDDNLISIHTGGWSENEFLIEDFKKTHWWFANHKITAKGGHYYFNTDFYSDKEWIITKL